MRFLIKQKIFSLSEGFTIKDEAGNDCFRVKSKIMSLGNKLRILEMDGTELCYMEQKLFKLFPEYHISINGNEVMVVKQKYAFLARKFALSGAAGEYAVEGNIIAKDFKIIRDGAPVVTISKKLLALTDTYTVDISDNENVALMLAVTVVIDMVCHTNK